MALKIPPPQQPAIEGKKFTFPWYRAFEQLFNPTGPTSINGFEVAGLPDASKPGQVIYVSDEAGGAVLAFSDGTDWRRVTDRNVVS